MDFTRKTLTSQPYLYVDCECPYGPEIAEIMGAAFAEVFDFVGKCGITPLSMPMSIYMNMDPNILRFRGAVAVSAEDAAKATGTIKSDTLPSGDVMHVTHTGPFDGLGQTHQTLWAHLATEGIAGTMPTWEIYIDDPGTTAPEALRTEIFCTIS